MVNIINIDRIVYDAVRINIESIDPIINILMRER